eukprot:3190238-Pyramimonas_sp.AAC.1
MGLLEHAVALLLAFKAYLRPGELDALTPVQLVALVAGAGFGQHRRALLLGPGELGAPTKVGAIDESVVLDGVVYLHECLAVLERRGQRVTDRIWSFARNGLSVEMQVSSEALGLGQMG